MSIRVILADDHAVVRDGLRMVLQSKMGIDVVGDAPNGREAVRLARTLSPDVAVLDITMPELNGIEATARIKEVRSDTQVVILSMHASSEHIFRALQAGAMGYVLKESAGREVVSAVINVHEGRRYLSQKITEAVVDDYIRQRQRPAADGPLALLSTREREVLQLVAEGKSSMRIAETMHLSAKTVETYRSRFMHKLGISDLAGVVRFAIQHGLTPLE